MTAYSLFRNAVASFLGSVVLLWIMGLLEIGLSVTGPIVIGRVTSSFISQATTIRSLIPALAIIFASYLGRDADHLFTASGERDFERESHLDTADRDAEQSGAISSRGFSEIAKSRRSRRVFSKILKKCRFSSCMV